MGSPLLALGVCFSCGAGKPLDSLGPGCLVLVLLLTLPISSTRQVSEPRMNMKSTILAGVVLFAAAASVSAQGTFSASTATGTKPRIMVDGVNVVAADNVLVEILVNGVRAVEPFQLTLPGANAGLFSKGTVTVPGKPGGSAVDITIRAWDKDLGPDFDHSKWRASTTLFAFVLGGAIDANGIAGLPNSIVPAFTGMGLLYVYAPEPSMFALAALGLGGLLFLRGK